MTIVARIEPMRRYGHIVTGDAPANLTIFCARCFRTDDEPAYYYDGTKLLCEGCVLWSDDTKERWDGWAAIRECEWPLVASLVPEGFTASDIPGDFGFNVRKLLRRSKCPPSYVVDLVDAVKYVPEKTGAHIGTVGQREEFTLRCVKVKLLGMGDYGERFLVKFTDAEENEAVWFTGDNCWAEEGETYTVRGTVNAHEEFNGRKQTVLSRVKRV